MEGESEVASYVAASTMTAVIMAGEKGKHKAAASPCEWFICDDPSTCTRYFVIKDSESFISWKTKLLFMPTKFEETDGLAHGGIYEAAKETYRQFVPEITSHMDKYGELAKSQFSGHSLGGTIALLLSLMLLSRRVVKTHNLRPVVTFGSPFALRGGRKILDHLDTDEDLIHSVIIHRDIVPRFSSCSYPERVRFLLQQLSRSLGSHPRLIGNKQLYTPLGRLFILQPDEKTSPPHPLLPPGNVLYGLDEDKDKSALSLGAVRAFLNHPHPLDALRNPVAYGSEGTIFRDHDSSNYLKALNGVLRNQWNPRMAVRRARGQSDQLWPLLTLPPPHSWNHKSDFDS